MTKDEFLRRFQLQCRPQVERPQWANMRQAAVLVPILEQTNGLHIILTRRSQNLRHHAGQISFPGGRYDETDHSLFQTAVREAQEEIGLPPQAIELVGCLSDYPVISNFIVRPFVALVQPGFELRANPAEVSEIFTVPINEVLQQQQHFVYRLPRFLYDRVYFIPYQERTIWGATAGMLRELADHIYPDQQRLHKEIL